MRVQLFDGTYSTTLVRPSKPWIEIATSGRARCLHCGADFKAEPDRRQTIFINGIPDEDTLRSRLKADLPRLMRHAAMVNRAIFWAVVASALR